MEVDSPLGWSCQLESHTKLLPEVLDRHTVERNVYGEKQWILRNANT